MRFLNLILLTSYASLGSAASSQQDLFSLYHAILGRRDIELNGAEIESHFEMFSRSAKNGDVDPDLVFNDTIPVLRSSLLRSIDEHETKLWVASDDIARFRNASLNDAKIQCGTRLNSTRKNQLPVIWEIPLSPVPEAFDSREAWPECADYIGHALDQSNCGSCWSFSTTTALEDRLCIQSGGKAQTHLSPLDTLSCCNEENGCDSFGCNGGDPASAWEWFVNEGVVTGGEYGDQTTCKPYAFPKCAHHVDSADLSPCSSGKEYDTPTCTRTCTNAAYKNGDYKSDKHRSFEAYAVPSNEDAIKRDIMTNGPVSAAFMVYEDFLAYKGGIYHHVTGNSVGGHAVKLIGWGKDPQSGEKYWILVNSWNPTWGEGGLFRMKLHEGGIMDEITAGKIVYNKNTTIHDEDDIPSVWIE